MVEKAISKVESRSSFYSDGSYKFHKYADYFPLMNSQELEELGKSIRKDGQRDDIVLIGEMIIDGRNRYFACQLEGITPRYKYYDSDLDPLDYVIIKNYYRRHLTPIQKAKLVVRLLKIEKKEAKERRSRSQLNGRTNRNIPKFKSSVTPSEGGTEEPLKKGEAAKIVAKKLKMSHNSVAKIGKIEKIAENNPFIKKYWDASQKNNLALEKAYRKVMGAVEIHKYKKMFAYKRLAEWEKRQIKKEIDLEKDIKKEVERKFTEEGLKYLETKKSRPIPVIHETKNFKKEKFCLEEVCPEIEKFLCRKCGAPNFLCVVSKTPVAKSQNDMVCYRFDRI